ncbi:MAG TPA: ion transporter [Candidatus Gracilibacteria bacterium]
MKKFCFECFHDYTNKKFQIIQGIIGFLVIISVATAPLQWFSEGSNDTLFWYSFTRVIVSIFTIEFLLRLYGAPSRLKYLWSLQGFVDLISIIPFYLYRLGLISKNIALILRGFRMLKLIFVDETHFAHLPQIENQGHYGLLTFNQDEKLAYIARRSPWLFLLETIFNTFLLGIILLTMAFMEWEWYALLFGVLFGGLLFFFYLRTWLNHHYDAIYVTNQRIVIVDKELFGAVLNGMPLYEITNIIPDTRGLLNTLLRMGSIDIETSGPEDRIGFPYIHNPYKAVEAINQQKIAYNLKQKR